MKSGATRSPPAIPAPLAVIPAPLAVIPAPLAVIPAPLAVIPAPLAVIPDSIRDPCLMTVPRAAWIADQVRNDKSAVAMTNLGTQ